MITKTIKYTNPFPPNQELTAEAYFHLNKNDLVVLQAEANDAGFEDVDKQFQAIISSGKNLEIFSVFKKLILRAYGKRQGSRFVKSQAISDDFEASEEFSELIWHLMQNEDELGEFFANLLVTPVERAPMLKDNPTEKVANMPESDQELFEKWQRAQGRSPQGTDQNVFKTEQPDPGEVVHQMPEVHDRGPLPSDDEEPKAKKPRLLQGPELEKMAFADVMKGVRDGRWRVE